MPDSQEKGIKVALAGILALAVAGLVSGTRPPVRERPTTQEESVAEVEGRALAYSELREGRRGPNATMYDSAFAWLRSRGPSLTDPVEQTEEERVKSLEARRERRAYAGAPPVVPHPIEEREALACLSCHKTGSLVGGLRAPMMSHEEFSMCVQCHAPMREEAPSVQARGSVGGQNTFAGVMEGGPGEIAWSGAPPTIPHSMFMREQCNSCHGPYGAQGLRTPHPVRSSCTQCHAPAAPFEQSGPPPLAPGKASAEEP